MKDKVVLVGKGILEFALDVIIGACILFGLGVALVGVYRGLYFLGELLVAHRILLVAGKYSGTIDYGLGGFLAVGFVLVSWGIGWRFGEYCRDRL